LEALQSGSRLRNMCRLMAVRGEFQKVERETEQALTAVLTPAQMRQYRDLQALAGESTQRGSKPS
jgi:hypothetical protein